MYYYELLLCLLDMRTPTGTCTANSCSVTNSLKRYTTFFFNIKKQQRQTKFGFVTKIINAHAGYALNYWPGPRYIYNLA